MKALTVHLAGKRVRLEDRDVLGEGGEGVVYASGGQALKIFHAPSATRAAKLTAFPKNLPSRVVGPVDLCTDDRGAVIGYAMKRLASAVDMHRVANKRWQKSELDSSEVLALFRGVADTLGELHARGIVVGDLNDGNVAVTKESGTFTPWFIDADSMQFGAFPCVVAHERFLDPELYGRDLRAGGCLSPASDWYALAVMLFETLLFVHPFGGTHPTHGTLLRRAEARHSVLRNDVKLPAAATRPDVLPDDALAWFASVFDDRHRGPLPPEVLDARFVRCSCGVDHARRACPACRVAVAVPKVVAVGKLRITRAFCPKAGRIVAFDSSAGLRHVVADDEGLHREDGALLCGPEVSPSWVAIEGSATWLGAAGRVAKVDAGRVASHRIVGTVRGNLAAAAGPQGLVYVDGDVVVRASDGSRLGQVLDGQTELRVGVALGFAFYRVGSMTVHFVFDAARGPLRQVSLPPLEGKLLDWSATFDDDHVLFTALTEQAGRRTAEAHLVDARGVVVASERGSPESSAILASVWGKCLARGAVLAATRDGLVLVRPDRTSRRFVETRVFEDAKHVISPDSELHLGPGGSLYVVSHDAIVHVCFDQGEPETP